MRAAAASLGVGLLFGLGLVISGMINPAKIIGFLDLFGAWDPTLAFVMAGALIVSVLGYRIVLKRKRPIIEEQFHLPTATVIDRRLIAGSALFGVGWGLSGFCPGPGITALTLGHVQPLLFVGAMLLGMAMSRLVPDVRQSPK